MRIGVTTPAMAVLVLLVMLLAVGCGSSGGSGSTGGSTTSGMAPGETATGGSSASNGEGGSQGAAPPGASAQVCRSTGTDASVVRATGVSCAEAGTVIRAWEEQKSCAAPNEASRYSCHVKGWLCQAVATKRGIVASCSRPERSIAFLFPR